MLGAGIEPATSPLMGALYQAELPEQVPLFPAGPGCRLSGCRSDLIPTGSIEPSNKLQHRE